MLCALVTSFVPIGSTYLQRDLEFGFDWENLKLKMLVIEVKWRHEKIFYLHLNLIYSFVSSQYNTYKPILTEMQTWFRDTQE